MLEDDKPENERDRLDPDHWYENNLSNASLFANLSLEGLPQVVPGIMVVPRLYNMYLSTVQVVPGITLTLTLWLYLYNLLVP